MQRHDCSAIISCLIATIPLLCLPRWIKNTNKKDQRIHTVGLGLRHSITLQSESTHPIVQRRNFLAIFHPIMGWFLLLMRCWFGQKSICFWPICTVEEKRYRHWRTRCIHYFSAWFNAGDDFPLVCNTDLYTAQRRSAYFPRQSVPLFCGCFAPTPIRPRGRSRQGLRPWLAINSYR